jgi:dTMP kinase
MTRRGLFISFEGIDGCGKTTQTKLLCDYFLTHNQPYLLTREPGGEPIAEKLRNLLLQTKDATFEAETELLLFIAARLQHWRRVIEPALRQGINVICDRFLDSSRIYQGVARGLGVDFYDNLHRLLLGDVKPDLTFLLDLPVENSLERIKLRGGTADYFEDNGLDFYHKLRSGFIDLANFEPSRIIKIDATLPLEAIHQIILNYVEQWQN